MAGTKETSCQCTQGGQAVCVCVWGGGGGDQYKPEERVLDTSKNGLFSITNFRMTFLVASSYSSVTHLPPRPWVRSMLPYRHHRVPDDDRHFPKQQSSQRKKSSEPNPCGQQPGVLTFGTRAHIRVRVDDGSPLIFEIQIQSHCHTDNADDFVQRVAHEEIVER